MGFWSARLLEGTKNKCINSYLRDVSQSYRAAVRSGFPALPKTIANIHVELAPSYFNELDVYLRVKGNFSLAEIDGHLIDAEAKALATVCQMLGFDFEQAEDILSDRAYDLADSSFDTNLTPQENFKKISSGKELNGKSVLYRHWVLKAFKFIKDQES
jgi:hypothetical protein